MHTTLPADALVDELADAVSALVRAWRHTGRRVGLDGSQSTLALLQLASLIGDGEHRLGEIAGLRGVDQSVISRQIGELQARGLVCRRPDPTDGRAGLVRLTPAGLALLDRVHQSRREVMRRALERCPATDVRAAAELVAALAVEFDTSLADPAVLAGLTGDPVPSIPER